MWGQRIIRTMTGYGNTKLKPSFEWRNSFSFYMLSYLEYGGVMKRYIP